MDTSHILFKYISKNKLNKNVRKMIIKDGLSNYIDSLCLKYDLPFTFNTIPSLQLGQIFYCELHPNYEKGKCLTCQKPTAFSGFSLGWSKKFCNASCQMKHPSQQQIRREDAQTRFGVTNYFQTEHAKSAATLSKSSPEYIQKISTIMKSSHTEDVIKKILSSRKKNAKPYWTNRYKHILEKLNEQGFTVKEHDSSGKPTAIMHNTCQTIQPYGRWSGDTYLCSTCCQNNRIKSETVILNELEQLFNLQLERNVKIGNYKFDGKFKNVLIDYNGLFWHSTVAEHAGFKEIDANYHHNRHIFAYENNYKYVQIFEDEWKNKKDIVIHRLRNVLGLSDKVYARKCELRKIAAHEAKAFLNTYHLNGHIICGFSIGLFYNADLVAVASFGKNRFSCNDTLELYRFCSKINVVGGLSKIMKYVSKEMQVDIVSYSDNFWGDGSGYYAAGFKLDAIVKPGYFYFDKKNFSRIARQAFTKANFQKTFNVEWDSTKNEEQNAAVVNCFRIYDAGKNRWLFAK